MNSTVHTASQWVYRGLWGVLSGWFHVPKTPPTLPALGGRPPVSFQPARGFLTYLTLQFGLSVAVAAAFELGGLAAALAAMGAWGLILAGLLVGGTLLFIAIGYLAIHLRYDTTWYVVSDRSLRIRRGIWVIHETTITFENVQNVSVRQGPLQRFCGIANVLVETAGGGSSGAGAHGGKGVSMTAHQGLIEGVDNAQQIRDLLLSRLRQSRTTGLGDEPAESLAAGAAPGRAAAGGVAWTPAHVAVLREIRDEVARLSPGG